MLASVDFDNKLFLSANKIHDVRAYCLLADEFAFVGGPKKAEYLASFKTRPVDAVRSAVSTDIQVQVYGDTAVLVALDTISGQNKGQPQVTKWLYMDVWVKRDGRWQCVKTYSSAAK